MVVPEAPVAAMPPSVASAPGSTGKKTPSGRSLASSASRVIAGLHGHVHVLDRQPQHAVHLAQVDRDAALHREHVALERRARAERDDRDAVAVARLDDRRRLLGRARVDDGVGRGRRMPGLVLAVLGEHVLAGQHPVGPEQVAEVVEGGVDTVLGGAHGSDPSDPLARIQPCGQRLSSGSTSAEPTPQTAAVMPSGSAVSPPATPASGTTAPPSPNCASPNSADALPAARG